MSFFIQTLPKQPKIDEPKFWADDSVRTPPEFDVAAYQKKLDEITGLSKDGHSIIRLKWAWDKDCFSEYYTDWRLNESHTIEVTKSEWRAKYRFTTITLDSETQIDICPPRWVLEELEPPGNYYEAWEQNRFQFNKTLNLKTPMKPPAPREGYYKFWQYIAAHDPGRACCERALKADHECFGVYEQPSGKHLKAIREIWGQIQRDPNRPNPYKPLSEKDLQIIQAESEAAEYDKWVENETQMEENEKHYTDMFGPRSAFSLPSKPKTTESGLILLP